MNCDSVSKGETREVSRALYQENKAGKAEKRVRRQKKKRRLKAINAEEITIRKCCLRSKCSCSIFIL